MTDPKPVASIGRMIYGERWDAVQADQETARLALVAARRRHARLDRIRDRATLITGIAAQVAVILILAAFVVGAWKWAL